MCTQKDRAEKLFEGTLSEEPPKRPNALRFSYCMGEKVDSLRLVKLLHMSDLPMLQAACNPETQLGRLEPKEEKDHDAFGALINYMTPRQLVCFSTLSTTPYLRSWLIQCTLVKVTYAPLYLVEGSPCAMLLLFPSVSEALCDIFKPSRDLQQPGGFVAVLLPWAVTGRAAKKIRTQYKVEERSLVRAPSVLSNPDPVKVSGHARSLRHNPSYHLALHILQFPDWLHRYLSQPDRKYALWFEPSDGYIKQDSSEWKGSETRALETILKRCGAQRAHLKDDKLRVIFVHVGSLIALQKFSQLARKRKKWHWVQFFTYGTHETVSPERWGIQEIYPLGTLTAQYRPFAAVSLFTFRWDRYVYSRGVQRQPPAGHVQVHQKSKGTSSVGMLHPSGYSRYVGSGCLRFGSLWCLE